MTTFLKFENPETNPVDNIITTGKHSSRVAIISRSQFARNYAIVGNDDNAHV